MYLTRRAMKSQQTSGGDVEENSGGILKEVEIRWRETFTSPESRTNYRWMLSRIN